MGISIPKWIKQNSYNIQDILKQIYYCWMRLTKIDTSGLNQLKSIKDVQNKLVSLYTSCKKNWTKFHLRTRPIYKTQIL